MMVFMITFEFYVYNTLVKLKYRYFIIKHMLKLRAV